MVPVAMTMMVGAVAFRCLDGGNTQAGQDAGDEEKADGGEAHGLSPDNDLRRTLIIPPASGNGCDQGRVSHSRIREVVIAGCSKGAIWPQWSITAMLAPAMASAISCARSGGEI